MAKNKSKKKTSKKKARVQPTKPKNTKDVSKLTGTKPVPRVVTQVLSYGSKLSELGFANDRLANKAQKLAGQLVKFAEQIGSTLDADMAKGVKQAVKAQATVERAAKAETKLKDRAERKAQIDVKKAARAAAKNARADVITAKKLAKIKALKIKLAALECTINASDTISRPAENLKA